jgi:DNA-directed RNA polymerase specialized sigma24 family protein
MTTWKDYSIRTTGDLVAIFQGKSSLPDEKKLAFYAVVHRFRKDLLEKCEINCRRFGYTPEVAEIIAENTFSAYAKKGKFDPKARKGITVDDSFRIYLYGIARNELTNYYRLEQKKRDGKFYDGSESIVTSLPVVDVSTLDNKAKIRYEIIQSLPQSQRTVYLTYKAHEKAGMNLSKKLMVQLRTHLGGVSQSTIRTYKKEANDRISEGMRIMDSILKSKS